MNWQRWRIALLVAIFMAILTACGAAAILDVKLDLKFALLMLGLIGKDVGLFLKDHPIDKLPPDKDLNGTTHFEKRQDEEK